MAGGSTFTWRHALQLHSTLSPFDSPFPSTHGGFKDVKPCSWKRINVAGILVTVYGLDELPPQLSRLTCLWLLHGRGDTQDSMGYTASAFLSSWNSFRTSSSSSSTSSSAARNRGHGLLCLAFDQRNHGSRLVDDRANISWKQGNPTHAQDMFAIYSGTARDLSHLLDHFSSSLPFDLPSRPSYSFSSSSSSDGSNSNLTHLVGGVSLGGHAVWQLLISDPRIRAGLVIVGCPDFIRIMTDRAIKARLPSCMSTSPPGRGFLGSKDFPQSLVEAVEKYDPAGVFLGELDVVTGDEYLHEPSDREKERLRPLLEERLSGKKVLCLSGGKDKLVGYQHSKPFLDWLRRATDNKEGWFKEGGIDVQDYVDPDARHEFSKNMREVAEKWLCEYLVGLDGDVVQQRGSKL